jgi:uncharacterized protein DUF3883/uncharacterized protein DUF3427
MTDGFATPAGGTSPGSTSVPSGNQPRLLELWETYVREEVHDIFDPQSTFTPTGGSWGTWGIVSIRDRPGDFVFFVTFGSKQGDHDFDESIDENGVLTWQSQPDQKLSDPQIKTLIGHDNLTNTIHLFLRTKKRPEPYRYLGTLGNLGHDALQEKPVHFTWQLLAGTPPDPVLHSMNLVLRPVPSAPGQSSEPPAPATPTPPAAGTLTKSAPPVVAPPKGSTKRAGSGRKQAVLPGQDARNADLGLKGELLVLEAERASLIAAGKPHLAAQVMHVSVVEGDGAGYDIGSYNPDGSHRHIEVKTTRGPATNAFFVTSHEAAFSRGHPNSYVLVRVYGYSDDTDSAQFYEMPGDLIKSFSLTPSEYRARLLPTPTV